MIVERRWSPFIKSFKKRSILAAAIIGGRSKTCRIIICDYVYPEVEIIRKDWPKNPKNYKKWMKDENNRLKVFGKDKEDNNILHHTYVNMMPDVRDMLRTMGYTKLDQIKAA